MASYLYCLEDFQRWKVPQLQDYLRKRGLKTNLKKAELAALAYGANVMGYPIKMGEEEKSLSKLVDYQRLLYPLPRVKLPDPFTDLEQGWLRESVGMIKWPWVKMSAITEYLLTCEDRDMGKRVLGDYKEGKAYSYFASKWLKEVFMHEITADSKWCYLKSECTPSDSINNPNHRMWVMITKETGEIKSAYCTCFAGLGSTCNHVSAVLFKLEDVTKQKKKGLFESCTSQPCSWNNYGQDKTVVKPLRVCEMQLKKPHYQKKDKEATINPARRQLFNPTEHSASASQRTTVNELLNALYPSCGNACIFEYIHVEPPVEQHPEADYNVETEVEVITTPRLPTPLTELPIYSLDPNYFFKNFPKFSQQDVASLEIGTRGQADSEKWKAQRLGRMTASIMHDVKTKTATLRSLDSNRSKDCVDLVSKIVYGSGNLGNIAAISYGRETEELGRKSYISRQNSIGHKKLIVDLCGLYVYGEMPYVGASPDGLVNCECCGHGLLEIKCPKNNCNNDPNVNPPEYLQSKGGISLKKSHRYYTQVQVQMGTTNTMWCDFVVYGGKGLFVERIKFDQNFWQEILECSEFFFKEHICPVLVARIIKQRHIIRVLPTLWTMPLVIPLGTKCLPSTSSRSRKPKITYKAKL